MRAFYNDTERFACDWLQRLMDAGCITPGRIDDRSIADVSPDDVAGYERVHFFAGIGGWDHALNLAGWCGPVWTGSCPCQPLSSAGQRKGHADERHVWPAFHRLIAQCAPPVVFGEQVASADGREWLAGIRTDLEALGYACGAADLCAASVGAPHIRQRLFWVADRTSRRSLETIDSRKRAAGVEQAQSPGRGGDAGGLANNQEQRRKQRRQDARRGGAGARTSEERCRSAERGALCGLADSTEPGWSEQQERTGQPNGRSAAESGRLRGTGRLADRDSGRQPQLEERDDESDTRLRSSRRHDVVGCGSDGGLGDAVRGGCESGGIASGGAQANISPRPGGQGFWSAAEWLPCSDGKARRTQPGIFPLAHGVSNRVGTLRGAGNAIVPQVAAQFVRAWLET